MKSFLAVSKQLTNHITTSFSQDRIQIRLTLALWHGIFITVCCLFIYLFIYLLSNAVQRESFPPSGRKLSVTG